MRRGRPVAIEGGKQRDALRVATRAQRHVRDHGADLVVVVIIRADGERYVFTSTDDNERAIGVLHRAAAALDRTST